MCPCPLCQSPQVVACAPGHPERHDGDAAQMVNTARGAPAGTRPVIARLYITVFIAARGCFSCAGDMRASDRGRWGGGFGRWTSLPSASSAPRTLERPLKPLNGSKPARRRLPERQHGGRRPKPQSPDRFHRLLAWGSNGPLSHAVQRTLNALIATRRRRRHDLPVTVRTALCSALALALALALCIAPSLVSARVRCWLSVLSSGAWASLWWWVSSLATHPHRGLTRSHAVQTPNPKPHPGILRPSGATALFGSRIHQLHRRQTHARQPPALTN